MNTKEPTNLAITGLLVVMAAWRRVSGEHPVRIIADRAGTVDYRGSSWLSVVSRQRPKNTPAVLPSRIREEEHTSRQSPYELLASTNGDITGFLVRDGR